MSVEVADEVCNDSADEISGVSNNVVIKLLMRLTGME